MTASLIAYDRMQSYKHCLVTPADEMLNMFNYYYHDYDYADYYDCFYCSALPEIVFTNSEIVRLHWETFPMFFTRNHFYTKGRINSRHTFECQNIGANVNKLDPERQQCCTNYKKIVNTSSAN